MSHKVAAAAAVVKVGSSSHVLYQGAVVPEGADQDDVARLVSLGYLVSDESVEAVEELVLEDESDDVEEPVLEDQPEAAVEDEPENPAPAKRGRPRK